MLAKMIRRRSRRSDFLGAMPGAILLLMLAAAQARTQVVALDFAPFNGHFQNYNAVARLAAGQVPFVEFPAYLGAGPLLLPYPLFLALGGDFAASAAAFEFLSVLLAGAAFGFGLRLSGVPSLGAWLLAVPAVALFPDLWAGHASALGLRSFLPFVAGYALLRLSRPEGTGKAPDLRHFALAGSLAGAFPLWSNDYGIATLAALAAVLCVSRFPGWRRFPVCTAAFAAAAAATFAIGAIVLTRGNPVAWIEAARAVAGAQFWYFNPNVAAKIFAPGDLPATPAILVSVAAVVAFLARWVACVRRDPAWAALAVVLLGTLGGVLASGVGGTFEERYLMPLHRAGLIAAAGMLGLAIRPMMALVWRPELSSLARRLLATLATIAAGMVCAAQFDEGRLAANPWPRPNAELRTEDLGGNLGSDRYLAALAMGRRLRAAYDVAGLPDDRRLLSVYSSVVSLASRSRQEVPDYAIHALGTRQAERFVAALDDGYANVEAPDPGRSPFGGWSSRMTWPFYRKLFSEWHPVGSTGYSTIWARRAVPLEPGRFVECLAELGADGLTWSLRVGSPQESPGETEYVEVTVLLEPTLKSSGVPLIGARGIILLASPAESLDDRVEDTLTADISTLALKRWTAQLVPGPLSFPVVHSPGRMTSVGLRAFPSGRATAGVVSCAARVAVAVSATVPR